MHITFLLQLSVQDLLIVETSDEVAVCVAVRCGHDFWGDGHLGQRHLAGQTVGAPLHQPHPVLSRHGSTVDHALDVSQPLLGVGPQD